MSTPVNTILCKPVYLFKTSLLTKKVLFSFAVILCLSQAISSPIALLLGIIIALCIGNPYAQYNYKATNLLLKFAVIGLGFGMNFTSAFKAGSNGFLLTVGSIIITLSLGYLLGKLFKVEKKMAYLLAVGTAICGGSAIAAISPVIDAKENDISVSLSTVFILNSIALFIFPLIGHLLSLNQTQFGLWCAIAIHDTSSVVGASGKFGKEALEIATTVKLARALWIIPVALLSATFFKVENSKVKIPWFIGLFIVAMAINTYFPSFQRYGEYLVVFSKSALIVTLFLIGSSLSYNAIKSIGLKPLFQGIILWTIITCSSLLAICFMHFS